MHKALGSVFNRDWYSDTLPALVRTTVHMGELPQCWDLCEHLTELERMWHGAVHMVPNVPDSSFGVLSLQFNCLSRIYVECRCLEPLWNQAQKILNCISIN